MLRDNQWEYFRGYTDRGSAVAVSKRLEMEGVPTQIHPRQLESAVEGEYWIAVQCSLAHRARWILAQLPLTDSELTYLATEELPGQE